MEEEIKNEIKTMTNRLSLILEQYDRYNISNKEDDKISIALERLKECLE